MKIILDLCGGTGAWSKPYKDNGYDVINITLSDYDILETQFRRQYGDMIFKGKKELIVGFEGIYGILAAPPCTMFSRARTTAKTPRDFKGAMEVVYACLQVIWEIQYKNHFGLKFWVLENSAGHLQRFLGKPALKFQPYEFGEHYSKETWLWGMFNEPKKNPVKLTAKEIRDSKVNTRPLPKIKGLKLTVRDRRAITPQGFAQAFYEANK